MLSGLKRSETLIGVGLSLGLILVVYGANRLSSARAEARNSALPMAAPEAIPAQFVVAARPIAKGRAIEAGDLAVSPGAAPAGAVISPDGAIGRVAIADIAARQVVSTAALARTGPGGDLASQVPMGYRAISIQTSDEIAVSNLLRPGDVVDIQVVLGDPVLAKGGLLGASGDRSEAGALIQGVRVIAVGDMVGPERTATATAASTAPAPPAASRTMTLAMKPDQVARFILARSLGAFYLSLRNPADREDAPPVVARLHDLRAGAVSSPEADAPPAPPRRVASRPVPARPPEGGVELVVGGERQTIFAQ